MNRPSFQFYPADWKGNAKLRRCSPSSRGYWLDVMCLFHDSDEYGLIRWPLKDISNSANVPIKFLHELVIKNVLKGSDEKISEPYIYIPRSGRKDGDPITLIQVQAGPLWYSSRMVRDEYIRKHAGAKTRFVAEENHQNHSPHPAPSRRHGVEQSDGSSSSSSSSSSFNKGIVEKATIPEQPKISKKFITPELSEIKNYFSELQEAVWPPEKIEQESHRYLDHYTSNGWKVGKNPMKDWRAAVRNWIKNSQNYSNGNSNHKPERIAGRFTR